MDRAYKAPWPDMPQEPPPGLLMSMAIRYDHGLGMPGYYDSLNQCTSIPGGPTHAQRLESTLRTMRQLYEEVSGYGFYSKAREAEYAALADSKTPNAEVTGLGRNRSAAMSDKATPAKVRLTDGLGRPPKRADFEAWAISAGLAHRNHQGFWFYRDGGDGLWEAYCAGAGDQRGRDAVASRDLLNAIFEDMRPRAA